jgi:hypothetical protein
MPTYIYLYPSPKLVVEKRKKIFAGGAKLQGVPVPDMALLPKEERGRWELDLKKAASDCGCTTGAAVGLISAACYALLAWQGLLPFEAKSLVVSAGLVVLVLGGSAGKLLGIALARRKLGKLARQLTQRVLSIELATR